MYIVIVGAGNVGYGLALELYSDTDYEILLVENDRYMTKEDVTGWYHVMRVG